IETAESRLSIGAPIANTQVYVLGPEGELLPVGFTGELHIAGDGIARGYLNQDQLTAQKFIKNPFSQKPRSRMYKTGDLGYWRPDGTLVYIGRVDDQVKIQGQRIELGEIESVMLESGLIKQALVMPRVLPHGTSQLLAYFVPKPDFEQSTVERFLKDRLPAYMLPSVWMELKEFPLNTSGKIDKNALPLPLRTASDEIEPETQLEKTLAEIWKNLLQLEQVYLGDNFFSIGGNSLLAMRVISKVRKELKMDIGIKDFFAHPTLFQFASHLQSSAGKVSLPPLREYLPRPPRIPLSFSQESLWFIDQLEGTIPYHLPIAMKMAGELNIIALDQTLKKLLARHEVLRTVIRDGREQHVLPWENWKWSYVEGGDYQEHEKEFKDFLRGLANAPFDLSSDYMLKATLVRLDRTEHVLVLVLHHIAFDAWSTPLLLQDLLELYKAYNQGEEPDLPALPIQYADFALWQKENFDDNFLEKITAYWKQKLEGLEPMRLPTDQPPSGVPDIAGGSAFFTIDRRLSEKIGELAAREGATLFMALLAAFKVLLYRYSAHTDICVGTAIAGRQAPETEDLVGYFINTLALRTQVEGTHSFKDVLKAVKTTTLEAFENQDLPFEKVVAAVGADRVSGQNPLFQVMFLLQNLPRRPPLNLNNLQLSFLNYPQDTAKFPLTFSISETANGLMGIVEYRAALFSDQMIKNMIGHYKELLKSIVTKPEQMVGSLTMLGATEEQRLLHTYNDTSGPYPKDKTVIDFFEERVKLAPDDPAVVFEEKKISYQELDGRANQLAHLLRSKGVSNGTPVLIGLERSVEMIVGLLGILKAGGSYVPIDPDYPLERIKYMREDSGAQWMVSSQSSQSKMQPLDNLETIYLDSDADLLRDQPRSKPEGQPDPQQLAYVMYTSGSTGIPKGVMIGHDNAGAFISWCREEFKSSRFDIVYATTSICFDLSVFEIFFPLSIGKPIRILENGLHIARHLPMDTAVLLNTVPGVIQSLLNETVDWSKVAVINMAGETIPAGVLEKLDTENIDVRNLYGPTEDTTYSTVYRLKPGASLYIGKPIANTQIYILNKEGALNPEGVPGEICISGAGVARGYLNRPELTAEKFVPNPFDRYLYVTLYKTGDRGRWMNGNIEFLGREDDQVKIRGYRIELGEIEKVLQAYGTVKEAVVLAKKNGRGEKQLVAYLVTGPGMDEAAIAGFLKSRLPGFMIPSLWIWLDKFPRTPNGKIDKNALPHPGADGVVDREFAAPRTVQEKRMAQIWAKVLDRTQVGIHDNFFELGGHSLLATTLMLEVREQLKVELSIKNLFDHPTISELSKVLDLSAQAVDKIPLVKVVPRPEKIPLSFNQESLWFIDQLEGSVQYHLPTVLRLNGPLDKEALEKALRSVLERHEVLRTVIRNTDGKPFQLVLPTTGWECSTVDQTLLRDKPEDLRDFILDTVHKPFDLAMDYLFRASLIILGKDQHILILTMHHIASDGWSVPLLLREITAHYLHYLNLQEAPEALPIQYADFALWQRNVLTESYLKDRGQYWKTKLRDLVPLRLPQDYPHPQVPSFRGATCAFFINNRLKARLMSLAQEEGATLYMTLLAAFKLMLYRHSSQTDICVGTAMSGRSHKEIELLIGYFINSLPLRTTVDTQSTYRDFLKVVKATCLEAFEHQDMPFDRIVAAVGAPRDLGRNPLFQVMFVLQNLPEFQDSDFAGVNIQREMPVQNTSKFDFTFILSDDHSGMEGTVEYRTDLFRASSIQKMTDSYLDILEAMVADPGEKLNGDTDPVTKDADDPGTALPAFVPVHQMITETAEKFGGDAAIFFGDQWISYRELNERANQLAHLLIEKGLRAGDTVGIFMHRSIEMVVAIHATLKAGGVYLPIDTEYPERRVKYFLEDSSAAFLITQQIFKDGFTDVPVITYEEFAAARTQYSSDNPEVKVRLNDAAYLIYTSGSTGKPKGVIIEHGNLYNLILSAGISPGMSASDKILGTTSISFDVSILELILPFVHGAKLYLMDRYQRKDPEAVLRSIAAHHITYLFATPTLLKMLLNGGWDQAFPSLNVCSAGEPLSKELAGKLLPLCKTLWNLYGPSETTVFSTLKQITDQEEEITIGHPIHNTRVYILRDNMEPVQGNEEGELYISGEGVGRGYLNRSKLSAERFMEDPFHRSGTDKMYRTGDMGRFSAAGEIVMTGRKDHQVKLRGHRIELGEVEHALTNFKNIKDALVTVREDESGNAKLVAYLTLSGKDTSAAKRSGGGSNLLEEKHYKRVKKWKKELSDFLPQVMVPTDFVVLENFPTTASGKIDWQALPAPESNFRLDPEATALEETPGEKLIAGIWKEALGIKNLGLTDNFFEIGGHSLIAIQVMTRLENESGIKLPLS
ncbi:MAG TPA: amino acid adenylation domain-containing protein, partial [Cyclobacteriaceae bacterium]|nr:amino acid adenylation domain-containing protein [Cyclobacteriaceae bacterium]